MRTLEGVIEMHPVRIPMRYRFRRIDHRESVLLRGSAGWGEFSPFPGYPPEVTNRWLASALESATEEMPAPVRQSIPINVTIPPVGPHDAAALVMESGATTAKVKVGEPGQSALEDDERVQAVRAALGPGGKIRIDVNASWDVSTAEIRIASLQAYDLEYVEQPVATVEEMIQLKGRVGVRLAADELVRLGTDPLEVARTGAADVLIMKVQPMGGVARVINLAGKSPLPVVISSALETSVGIYSGLAAAAALADLPLACGLGTVALLEGDPTREPLVPHDGFLEVRRPEPDPELLERWRPDDAKAFEMLRSVRDAAEELR